MSYDMNIQEEAYNDGVLKTNKTLLKLINILNDGDTLSTEEVINIVIGYLEKATKED